MIISKYLKDIGLTQDDLTFDDNDYNYNKETLDLFKKQREEHGFDEREVWSLRYNIALYLYTRIKMYDETSDELIDKDFHKFEYKDKEYTFQECINMVLEGLRLYLTKDDFDMTKEEMECVMDSMIIFGKIWLYLWW